MRLFLDIDTREFLQSPSFPRALTTLAFKRRDTDLIELQFLRDRTVQDLPTGTTIRLGLKPDAAYTAEFLASGTFTKDGTGTATRYLLELNLNTVPLNAAFAASTPEPVTLPAMLEIEWASGTTISSSRTLPIVIANDVIRGDEGTPAAIPDGKATQEEAEAGTDNEKWMTPLRTKQALAIETAALGERIDLLVENLDTEAIDSIAEAASSIASLQTALEGKQDAGDYAAATHGHTQLELSGLTVSDAAAIEGELEAGQIVCSGDTILQSVEIAGSAENNPFVVDGNGRVGIGVTPDSTAALAVDSGGIKFTDGTTLYSAAHPHAIDDVTGLQAGLDAKASASALEALTARVAALEAAQP
jgi:hypothetical protein